MEKNYSIFYKDCVFTFTQFMKTIFPSSELNLGIFHIKMTFFYFRTSLNTFTSVVLIFFKVSLLSF